MSAYGLTERERDVTRLILRGSSTAQIAEQLVVSAHRQQHLKNIFGKTGVRSRRDLIAKVFFAHYEPRFRDYAHRTASSKPVRGGPKNGQCFAYPRIVLFGNSLPSSAHRHYIQVPSITYIMPRYAPPSG